MSGELQSLTSSDNLFTMVYMCLFCVALDSRELFSIGETQVLKAMMKMQRESTSGSR